MAKLTEKQKKWITEYLVDFNATRAARDSGYSEATAGAIGCENLTKPNIQEEIAKRVDAMGMTAPEITKRFTNLARGNMSDYMVKKYTEYTPRIRKSLEELISRLRNEIDFEDDYALEVNLKAEELEEHMKSQEDRRRRVIRYKLELQRNPNAYRIVSGETILVEEMVLDLVKITEDKERGIIRSVKHTKDGVQVELYHADAALAQLAKIRGMTSDKEIDVNVNVETVTRIGYGDKNPD